MLQDNSMMHYLNNVLFVQKYSIYKCIRATFPHRKAWYNFYCLI